ncbi:phosphinothricin acetyltransferase [Novosphingobium kunmingense]|uniref:Phosphinothricin acetyltransferase n=1 Tax=Novosphingobium kunmingense TaxID=1211806 RepID=A0A2N0HJV5_9SPHN|nr:GNAT family N-acetyltransferase [Novosphingobium kunmingense]PKB19158.1 phosphinothricin acetyltransferase [Novosphingobium kunmingense]
MRIEPASDDDVPEMAAIYGHHVLHGTASYETVPPTTAEMAARLASARRAGWPWLVARDGEGALVGYAYVNQFRDRAAYRYACENSIYIRHDRRGEGIGTALLRALMDAATAFGFRQMFAVIGGAEPGSVALHAACGFVHAGRMHAIGRKHGRWLDTVYMQAGLGEGSSTAPPQEPR